MRLVTEITKYKLVQVKVYISMRKNMKTRASRRLETNDLVLTWLYIIMWLRQFQCQVYTYAYAQNTYRSYKLTNQCRAHKVCIWLQAMTSHAQDASPKCN